MTQSAAHSDVVHASVFSRSDAAYSSIASSWRRSLVNFGLDPMSAAKIARVDNSVLASSREEFSALLYAASTEMDRLFGLVCDAGCGLYLTDNTGLVLDHRCMDADTAEFSQLGLEPGADCSEASEGTNGMGTCLAVGKPVVVHRDEHFRARNTAFSCIAAPVFGADGEIIAALDISTARADQTRTTNTLMANALLQSTQRIETTFFRHAYPEERILVADSDGRAGTALLAVNSDDLVVGATRAARLAFGLSLGQAFEPKPAADILGQSHNARDISAIQKSAILRALVRASGNVSAAARQLGIGRTTLYRRMKDLGIDT